MRTSRRAFVRRVAGLAVLVLNGCAAPPESLPPAPTVVPKLTPVPVATNAPQSAKTVAPPTILPMPTVGAAPALQPPPAATLEPTSVPTTSGLVAPTLEPTPTPAPTLDFREQGQRRYIAHTGGDGVLIRSGCADQPSGPGGWPEGADVIIDHSRPECSEWVFVKRTSGDSSWVRAPYLSATAPTPTAAPTARSGSRPGLQSFEIGKSVRNKPLVATSLGNGPVAVAFIGNIHGGWEPVSREVVEMGLEHFRQTPSEVPDGVTLYFLPTMNPDGYEAGRPLWGNANGSGGAGDVALARTAFNANGIDLNRNFATNWTRDACGGERVRLTWGLVDDKPCRAGLGGEQPFSEPETQAYRDFILTRKVSWVLSYHEDQRPAILIREGGGGASEPFAEELSRVFNYPYVPRTLSYRVTGHAWDWFDANGIRGAEIELKYRAVDQSSNLRAMKLAIQRALGH